MNNKKGGKTNYNGKRRTVEKLTKKEELQHFEVTL